MSSNVPLPAKKIKAIETLLLSGSVTQAAKVANVHRKTVQRWLRDDQDFNQVLAATEAEALRLLAAQMAANSGKAASALMDVIDSPDATKKETIAAARAYLASLPTAQMLGRLGPALTELERKTNET